MGETLVTGGAGYIGSHVVRQLLEAGERVVVIDNLANGYRGAVGDARLYVGDVNDQGLLENVFRAHNVRTIMHFAALMAVADSVRHPARYYVNNTCGTANILQFAVQNGIENFVFSSSAAVYGIPKDGVCREDTETRPINPYGHSKLFSEQILRSVSAASGIRHVILRYFNVAGADPKGRMGQRGRVSTHVTKIACEVAVGKRKFIEIYGTDYPTRDGTCVRDYIHVEDLAAAHLSAKRYMDNGGPSTTLNCGYGKGFSVHEVIDAVSKARGEPFPVRTADRRQGDPPVLVAAADRIREVLDWIPNYDNLDAIARTALAWEESLAQETAKYN